MVELVQNRTLPYVEEALFEIPPGRFELDHTRDGKHVFVVHQPGEGVLLQAPGPQTRAFWDGVPGLAYDEVAQFPRGFKVVWGPDGRHVAWVCQLGERFRVQLDGTNIGPDLDGVAEPSFSPDGSRLAYGAVIDGTFRLVLDGTPLLEFQLACISGGLQSNGRPRRLRGCEA